MGLNFKKKSVIVGQKTLEKMLPPDQDMTTPRSIKVPPPPTRGEDEGPLRDEQQVLRTEEMMLKGIRHRLTLMKLLEIDDPRQMDRYMERVKARWEMVGSNQDFARARGESLQRLDKLEYAMWTRLDEVKNHALAAGLGRTILSIAAHRADLLGLTPKIIATIGNPTDSDQLFKKESAAHERVARLASRMVELLDERMKSSKVIEHEPPGANGE